MAASADHEARPRPSPATLRTRVNSPRSPHTPVLGRSISSQFGSPGALRAEPDDVLIYELDQQCLSAGFAGESRPRCILPFAPHTARRLADYRIYSPAYQQHSRPHRLREDFKDRGGGEHGLGDWGASHTLYQNDYHSNLHRQDLGLVEDKLERAFRHAWVHYLQTDPKQPRRTLLVVPSLLPKPLIEIALKVIFGHFTAPPAVSLLSNTIMCCVGAGLRHALLVDVGWEETVVTAIGEYKEACQGRSIRAGKKLTAEMGRIIEGSVPSRDEARVTFDEAHDITQRMAWCQLRTPDESAEAALVQLPVPGGAPTEKFSLLFEKLAEPAERVLLASGIAPNEHDDGDLPIHLLAHRVLVALPVDLRSLCISRIVVTGAYGKLPGLRQRLLQEIEHLASTRGWDAVSNYGSAKGPPTPALKDRSPHVATLRPNGQATDHADIPLGPLGVPIQDSIPAMDRVHDDIKDLPTIKAEREQAKGRVAPVKGVVRGVETLGAWAGASLMASLRVKGAHEVEREDFFKSGLKDQSDAV